VSRGKSALLAVIGLAIVVFAIGRIGTAAVMREMQILRVALPAIIGLSFVRLYLQTTSWALALREEGVHARVGALMLMRLASQGVGYLTVLGPMASEPMKIDLLRRFEAENATTEIATATLLDTGVYWFSSSLIGIAGCLSAGLILSGAHARILVGVLGAGFVASLLFLKGSDAVLVAAARSLGSKAPGWLTKAGKMEIAIRSFSGEHPATVRTMLILGLACQVLLAAEVAVILFCARQPLKAGTLLGLEAANRLIKIAGGWMPARIGADEGGAISAFVAFGLPAASGLTLALARRARDLVASMIGLTWFAWRQRSAPADGMTT
jgi:hypothetical protein